METRSGSGSREGSRPSIRTTSALKRGVLMPLMKNPPAETTSPIDTFGSLTSL